MNPRVRLKRYREENGLSVIDLAELLHCSKQMVYALEAGTDDKLPGRVMGKRIQAICGIPDSEWSRIARIGSRLKTA